MKKMLLLEKCDFYYLTLFYGAPYTLLFKVGELCYRKQTGTKYYDMLETRTFREDVELETPVGNMTSIVIHQGLNFWIVNTLPWYVGGVHQCICTHIRETGVDGKYYYPIQYNWVDNTVYIGREIIGIEYINVEREVSSICIDTYILILKNVIHKLKSFRWIIGHLDLITYGLILLLETLSECGSHLMVFRSIQMEFVSHYQN